MQKAPWGCLCAVIPCEKHCPDSRADVLFLFSPNTPQNQVTDTNRKLQNEGKEVSAASASCPSCLAVLWPCLLVANHTGHQ